MSDYIPASERREIRRLVHGVEYSVHLDDLLAHAAEADEIMHELAGALLDYHQWHGEALFGRSALARYEVAVKGGSDE